MILWIVLYSKQLRSNNLNKRFFKTDMYFKFYTTLRGGSRVAAASKMERFVIIVQGWKPLTIITKYSILNVAAALDPPLLSLVSCIDLFFCATSIFVCFFSNLKQVQLISEAKLNQVNIKATRVYSLMKLTNILFFFFF